MTSVYGKDGGAAAPSMTVVPADAAWRKSSRSSPSGDNCVEVAVLADGVAVRDSKNRDGDVLRFTGEEWAAFVAGAKAGEFDLT